MMLLNDVKSLFGGMLSLANTLLQTTN